MAATGQGEGVNPKDLKRSEAATASVKKAMEQVAKLAADLGRQSPPSDAKAKKEYEALLKKFLKSADDVAKASSLLKKKEETARKGMPKDQQKLVAGKLGKSVAEIDKLGTGIKKSAQVVQANAKKGGSGTGDDKAALKKLHAANQAMGAVGKRLAPSQVKVLLLSP